VIHVTLARLSIYYAEIFFLKEKIFAKTILILVIL